jgi:hypothetical protein
VRSVGHCRILLANRVTLLYRVFFSSFLHVDTTPKRFNSDLHFSGAESLCETHEGSFLCTLMVFAQAAFDNCARQVCIHI